MAYRSSILIVEDDPLLRDFLVELLDEAGYKVRVAETAAGARAAVAGAEPDLLLCDYWLPDGSGFVLAGELRHMGIAVPIVLMSGDEWSVQALDQSLIAGCLLKPFEPKDLLAAVGAYIRRAPASN